MTSFSFVSCFLCSIWCHELWPSLNFTENFESGGDHRVSWVAWRSFPEWRWPCFTGSSSFVVKAVAQLPSGMSPDTSVQLVSGREAAHFRKQCCWHFLLPPAALTGSGQEQPQELLLGGPWRSPWPLVMAVPWLLWLWGEMGLSSLCPAQL